MANNDHPAHRFIQALRQLAPVDAGGNVRLEVLDRAALATLRRGLGKPPGAVFDLYPYVIPYAPPHQQDTYFLVAALFAMHPRSWRHPEDRIRNFGVSWRHLVESDPNGRESREQRFVALLRASPAELDNHLRHAVSLLAAKDISVDWEQLIHDLPDWNHTHQRVQRAWSRSYWVNANTVLPRT